MEQIAILVVDDEKEIADLVDTQGLNCSKLMICFLILTVGWIVTAIGTLIFSAIVKNSVEDKRAMREAILPCIFKVIIMVAVLWFVLLIIM